MAILALIPVGCSLLLWLIHPLLEDEGIELAALFPQMAFFLFLHFLLPVMAVFIGTAVLADEVDDRTLPYLLVRPVPRWMTVLSKTIASCFTVGILLFLSLILTYTVMMLGSGAGEWFASLPRLLRSGGVLFIGFLVYVPLFGLLGGILKRPVLTGLLFTFGWEKTVAFFPGNVKKMTVVHYLHVIFPKLHSVRAQSGRSALLELVLPTKQISPVLAIVILLLLAVVFGGLLASLLSLREYRLEQS